MKTSEMKPMLCNTKVVQNILADRQTQDRRPIKPQPIEYADRIVYKISKGSTLSIPKPDAALPINARYEIGDILYVRETFWQWGRYVKLNTKTKTGRLKETFEPISPPKTFIGICFAHTGTTIYKPESRYRAGYHKRPSIFMPKEIARIFLKVISVEVKLGEDGIWYLITEYEKLQNKH